MAKISEGTMRLIEMRDAVDEKFVAYATPETLHGNFASLSQLALIGGRLDTIIRRNLNNERKLGSVHLLRDRNGSIDFGPEPGPGT